MSSRTVREACKRRKRAGEEEMRKDFNVEVLGKRKEKQGEKKIEQRRVGVSWGLERKLELGVTRIMVEDTHEAETHGLKWEFE